MVSAISFIAFFLNGITGFGSSLVFIPLAALVIGPKEAIIVCSALNPFAFTTILRIDTKHVSRSYWLPLCIAMVLGNVVGALTLKSIPNQVFGTGLGVIVLSLGVWFLGGRRGGRFTGLTDTFPASSNWLDAAICGLAGFCGGSFGMSGPPLVWHFGRKFAKEAFRKVLVLMLLPASFFRIGAYLLIGLVSLKLCWLVLVSLPFMFIGTYLGNHVFTKISLSWFNYIIGGVLVVSAVRLLMAV